ncbi:hypothetical protein [Streptomyces sp. NPDC048436]|uniref:hypothetical protein n=1 Tax=Streptomyces sp. NPDC048436 TaxID=3365550 RepID=UPI0037244C12
MAVTSTLSRPREEGTTTEPRTGPGPGSTAQWWTAWWPSIAICAPFAAFVWLVVQREPWMWDYGQHASVIDRLQQSLTHPGNPLLDLPNGSSPYYTPYTVAAACVGRMLGLTAFGTLKLCALFNMLLLFSGVCRVTAMSSTSRWAPPTAVLFALFLWGPHSFSGAGYHCALGVALTVGFPSYFALGAALHLWVAVARWAHRPRPVPLLLISLAAAVTLISHTIAGTGALLGCAAFLARPFTRLTGAQRLQLASAVALFAASVISWPYYNVLTLAGSGQLDALHVRAYDDLLGVYGFGVLGIVAILVRARRDVLDPFALLACMALAAVTYGWFSGHYTLSRMFVFAMLSLQLALAIEWVTWLRRRNGIKRLLAGATASACAVGIWAQSSPVVWLVPTPLKTAAERALPPALQLWPHLDWAAAYMRRGDVVAATAKPLSHLIPAYGVSLISPAWPDPALSNRESAARAQAQRALFSPRTTPPLRQEILARYQVRWILASPDQAALFARAGGVTEVRRGPQGTVLFRARPGAVDQSVR